MNYDYHTDTDTAYDELIYLFGTDDLDEVARQMEGMFEIRIKTRQPQELLRIYQEEQ